jgi:hypothetical protein
MDLLHLRKKVNIDLVRTVMERDGQARQQLLKAVQSAMGKGVSIM